jgi:hypothetical protein
MADVNLMLSRRCLSSRHKLGERAIEHVAEFLLGTCDWAAGHSWAIAMNVFRAPDQPVYVLLTADEVKALAQRTMPTTAARP